MRDFKTDKGTASEAFCRNVYAIVREIPTGKVLTYGEIARLLGKPQASRMVGYALKHVPTNNLLPCHRVVNAQGRLVPGWNEQKSLLLAEGICFKQNGKIDLEKYLWQYEGLEA